MPQEEMQYPVQTICVILGGSHGLVLPADFHFPSLRLIYISHFHTFILSVYVYWLLTHCQELLIPGTWGWNKSPLSSQLNPTLLHVVLMFATKVTLHSSDPILMSKLMWDNIKCSCSKSLDPIMVCANCICLITFTLRSQVPIDGYFCQQLADHSAKLVSDNLKRSCW